MLTVKCATQRKKIKIIRTLFQDFQIATFSTQYPPWPKYQWHAPHYPHLGVGVRFVDPQNRKSLNDLKIISGKYHFWCVALPKLQLIYMLTVKCATQRKKKSKTSEHSFRTFRSQLSQTTMANASTACPHPHHYPLLGGGGGGFCTPKTEILQIVYKSFLVNVTFDALRCANYSYHICLL